MPLIRNALLAMLSVGLPWSVMGMNGPTSATPATMPSTAITASHAPTAPAVVAKTATPTISVAPVYVDGMGPSVQPAKLAGFSGGSDINITSNKMTLNGTVSNTDADHVVTGMNVIGGDSFAGSVGIPMVIQNSGNNVLIQNATIVNVQFKP